MYPIQKFLSFPKKDMEPGAEPWIDTKISGSNLRLRGDQVELGIDVTEMVGVTCQPYHMDGWHSKVIYGRQMTR